MIRDWINDLTKFQFGFMMCVFGAINAVLPWFFTIGMLINFCVGKCWWGAGVVVMGVVWFVGLAIIPFFWGCMMANDYNAHTTKIGQ